MIITTVCIPHILVYFGYAYMSLLVTSKKEIGDKHQSLCL